MKASRRARPRTISSRSIRASAIIWAAIWLGTAVVLRGGGDFADMIPILGIGTAWFLAVVPALVAGSDRGGTGRD